jgi:transposase
MSAADSPPDDVEALKAMLRDRDAERAQARATALIGHLQVSRSFDASSMAFAASARRGCSSRWSSSLFEADATADELAAEQKADAAKTTAVGAFSRRKPSRQPFLAHLPRERVVLPGPAACACCGERVFTSSVRA